jgi:hypothetical protein
MLWHLLSGDAVLQFKDFGKTTRRVDLHSKASESKATSSHRHHRETMSRQLDTIRALRPAI